MDMTTTSTGSTLASRNTGSGLKTRDRSAWFGQWDSPYKTHIGDHTVTQSSAGAMGSQTGFGGSQGLGGGTGGATNGGGTTIAETMNFRRRQANSLNYYTPVFGGFRGALQWAPDETARLVGGAGAVPELWSGRVDYAAGPFSVSAAYEHHTDYLWGATVVAASGLGAAAGAGTRSKDKAFSLAGSYRFGDTQLLAFWERLKWSQNGGAAALLDLDSTKWNIGVVSKISGPHGASAAYGRVGSYGCNAVAGWAGTCTDTGAQHYELLYKYQLDKVSYINVLYARFDNDRNGRWVPTGGAAGAQGASYQSMSVGLQTSF